MAASDPFHEFAKQVARLGRPDPDQNWDDLAEIVAGLSAKARELIGQPDREDGDPVPPESVAA